MKQCVKVPFGEICFIWVCAKWVSKLWILSEKSRNFDKKSNPNQSKPNQSEPSQSKPNQSEPNQSKPNQSKPNQRKPNQSNLNFLKSPRAPWSYFFVQFLLCFAETMCELCFPDALFCLSLRWKSMALWSSAHKGEFIENPFWTTFVPCGVGK